MIELRIGPCTSCGKKTFFFCKTQYNDPDTSIKSACIQCNSVWADDPSHLLKIHAVPKEIDYKDYSFLMSEEGTRYINSIGTIEDIFYVLMMFFRRKGIEPRFYSVAGGMFPDIFAGFWSFLFYMPDGENFFCIRENYNNVMVAGFYQKTRGLGAEYNYTDEELGEFTKLIMTFVIEHGDHFDLGYPSIMLLANNLDPKAADRMDKAQKALESMSQNFFSQRYGYNKVPTVTSTAVVSGIRGGGSSGKRTI
jgi:hypothetical protein